jgi:hypothetical protein
MANNPPRVPRKTVDYVNWIKPRGPKWKLNATGLGLSTVQGTQIDAASANVFNAYEARLQAEQDFRAAVATLEEAINEARTLTGECMRTIDAFATVSADPTAVYNLAEFPAPQPPKPAPAPGVPSDLRVSLSQTGTLELTWKCENPGAGGVVYEIKRSIGSDQGPFTYLSIVGKRKFEDTTVPAGSSSVFYQVTGVRSTQRGSPAVFLVRFGTGGGGLSVTAVKKAA